MKSILADYRRAKTAIITFLEALNCDFLVISHFQMSKFPENSKVRAAKVDKTAVFGGFNLAKIDFT